MFHNGRKTICLLISKVDGNFFSSLLCKGIVATAKSLGYNVIILTSFTGFAQAAIRQGEMEICNLVDYSQIAGVIIAGDTIQDDELEQRILSAIEEKSTCPIVYVRKKKDGYYNILVDDSMVLEDTIRHFIVKHKFTKLAFMAGPRGYRDSDLRLECFLRIMKEFNLPVTEANIFYGDFWKNKTDEAITYFLGEGKERPEAIICANDYMAIDMCDKILDKGIRIPEDICISGYDDLPVSSGYCPSITTAGIPVLAMGDRAVRVIDDILSGKSVEKDIYLQTYTVYRESCGCGEKSVNSENSLGRRYINEIYAMRAAFRGNDAMSNTLTGIDTLNDLYEPLNYFLYENRGFKNFYMCLCDDWWKLDRASTLSDKMKLVFTANGRNKTYHSPLVSFPRKDLLPKGFVKESPVSLLFSVLHQREKVFGYVAINYVDDETYSPAYEGWLVNLGNAIENIRNSYEMNRLVSELTRTYTVDALTGLYNRRGLSVLSNELLASENAASKRLMIICADMDDLKVVNDNYGHADGDIAIKAISDCLRTAAHGNKICARTGGDEFTVIGLVDSDEEAQEFQEQFQNEVVRFNESSDRPWRLHVSCGWHVMSTKGLSDIEEGMTVADALLYKQKAINKARRLVEEIEGKKKK